MRRIDVSDPVAKMRYRCPRGHSNVEEVNSHWYCQSCARQADHGADVNPEFDKLHDAKTGETIPRDEVEIVRDSDPVGVAQS